MPSSLAPKYLNMDPEVSGMHLPFVEFAAARSLSTRGDQGNSFVLATCGSGPMGMEDQQLCLELVDDTGGLMGMSLYFQLGGWQQRVLWVAEEVSSWADCCNLSNGWCISCFKVCWMNQASMYSSFGLSLVAMIFRARRSGYGFILKCCSSSQSFSQLYFWSIGARV